MLASIYCIKHSLTAGIVKRRNTVAPQTRWHYVSRSEVNRLFNEIWLSDDHPTNVASHFHFWIWITRVIAPDWWITQTEKGDHSFLHGRVMCAVTHCWRCHRHDKSVFDFMFNLGLLRDTAHGALKQTYKWSPNYRQEEVYVGGVNMSCFNDLNYPRLGNK